MALRVSKGSAGWLDRPLTTIYSGAGAHRARAPAERLSPRSGSALRLRGPAARHAWARRAPARFGNSPGLRRAKGAGAGRIGGAAGKARLLRPGCGRRVGRPPYPIDAEKRARDVHGPLGLQLAEDGDQGYGSRANGNGGLHPPEQVVTCAGIRLIG